VTPRARVTLVVAALALAAAGVTVGATLLATKDKGSATTGPPRRAGPPPLLLDLGVRDDPEARALRRAVGSYYRGRLKEAGAIFARRRSLFAQVGVALAAWPHGTLPRLESLARAYPRSGLVRLHLGLVLAWNGRTAPARAAWRDAQRLAPDSLTAIRAEDFLHPDFPPGLPQFVPSFAMSPRLARLPAPRQLAALERRARRGGIRPRLLYCAALQRLGRERSAGRQYAAAVQADPGAAEPRVALAVVRFTKADPSRTFSRLGPLSRRFPRSQSVRFHLGLCLLWLRQVDAARHQLELARAAGRKTVLGREAERFLARLRGVANSPGKTGTP
jgi:tetratricopeptide (TPR) repeat protein